MKDWSRSDLIALAALLVSIVFGLTSTSGVTNLRVDMDKLSVKTAEIDDVTAKVIRTIGTASGKTSLYAATGDRGWNITLTDDGYALIFQQFSNGQVFNRYFITATGAVTRLP